MQETAAVRVIGYLLVLIISAGLPLKLKAEPPVYFADTFLKAIVQSQLGITEPTLTDMLALTNLQGHNTGIEDLTGLEYATNLTTLLLSGNKISNLEPLSKLTKLTVLQLQNNPLNNASYCIYLPMIRNNNPGIEVILDTGVECESLIEFSDSSLKTKVENTLGVADITPTSIVNLTYLSASYRDITDLRGLESATNLLSLNLRNNQISDISPLSGLKNLTALYLENNPLNNASYCIYLPLIQANNPDIKLTYDKDNWCSVSNNNQQLNPSNREMNLGFYMGATVDGGMQYRNRFSSDEKIHVNAAIVIDSDSVGKKGFLYVVVVKNASVYMLTADQGLISWDFNMMSLLPMVSLPVLTAEENFKVFDDLWNAPGNYHIYIGYQSEGGELYYNVEPLEFIVD